ncbi:MAG: phosphatidylglycerol lysyltransferase domain-containing protein, partial [Albidovulum sp.]
FKGRSVARASELSTSGIRLNALLMRQLLPLSLVIACLYLVGDRIGAIHTGAVFAEIRSFSAWQWFGALAATALSFWALGWYDAVLHRSFGTGVSNRPARRAGMTAIAISQMVGVGLISGALVRWRMLPGLSLAQATKLTLLVTLSFLAGWSVVTAIAVLSLAPAALPYYEAIAPISVGGLIVAFVALILCLIRPHFRVVRRLGGWLPLARIARILALTCIDTLAACLVLYLLMPTTLALSYVEFLPVFLLAFGAGLILGTPGGIGPFEITLMTLLPDLATEPLAAAVLGYRIVYLAAPAALAGLVLLLVQFFEAGSDPVPLPQNTVHAAGQPAPPILMRARRAEVLLYRQGEHRLLQLRSVDDGMLVANAGQCLVGLFDPVGRAKTMPQLIKGLCALAQDEDRIPALYKIGAQSAALARKAGWVVHPMSEEFWLAPRHFTLNTSARSGLRRKLRRAEAAGATVAVHCPSDPQRMLPWDEMGQIADSWKASHSGELGFSMGRFERGYLEGQRLYLAFVQGQLKGFASFHEGRFEWTLDLMRQASDAPDGTMHSLIIHAITDASNASIARLSLAAVPLPGLGLDGMSPYLARQVQRLQDGAGLARFKQAFGPQRSPLYMAAPGRLALCVAATEIARSIRYPAPIFPQSDATGRGYWRVPQDLHDQSSIS